MAHLRLEFIISIVIASLNFIAISVIPFYLGNTIKLLIEEFLTKESFYLLIENIFRKKLNNYLNSNEFNKDVEPIIKSFIREDAILEKRILDIVDEEYKEYILGQKEIKELLEKILSFQ